MVIATEPGYVGDNGGVAHSLMLCGMLGVNVRIGCPEVSNPCRC